MSIRQALCKGASSPGEIDFMCLFVLTLNFPHCSAQEAALEIQGDMNVLVLRLDSSSSTCQTPSGLSPQVELRVLSKGQGLPEGPQATIDLGPGGHKASSESVTMIQGGGDERQKRQKRNGQTNKAKRPIPLGAMAGGHQPALISSSSPYFDLLLNAYTVPRILHHLILTSNLCAILHVRTPKLRELSQGHTARK